MKYFQFSDGHFSCRLKALVLTKFNLQQKAINRTTACVSQPRTRLVRYAGYGLLKIIKI